MGVKGILLEAILTKTLKTLDHSLFQNWSGFYNELFQPFSVCLLQSFQRHYLLHFCLRPDFKVQPSGGHRSRNSESFFMSQLVCILKLTLGTLGVLIFYCISSQLSISSLFLQLFFRMGFRVDPSGGHLYRNIENSGPFFILEILIKQTL